MQHNAAPGVSFSAIEPVLIEGMWSKIVRKALLATQARKSLWTRQLIAFINKHIKIDGFRAAEKAITSARLQELNDRVAEMAKGFPPLVAIVLSVWAEEQTPLRQAVEVVLAKHRTSLDDQAFSQKNKPLSLSIAALRDEVQQTLPDTLVQDIELMVIYLLGHMPIEQTEQSTMESEKHTESPTFRTSPTIWRDLFVSLSILNPTDMAWDDELTEQFVAEVLTLARQKREERDVGYSLLEQALTALHEEQGAQLTYFSMAEARAWSADACPRPAGRKRAGQIDQLRTLLAEHRSVRSQIMAAANYNEEATLTQQNQELGSTVREIYSDLSAAFAADQDEPNSDQHELNVDIDITEPTEEPEHSDDHATTEVLPVAVSIEEAASDVEAVALPEDIRTVVAEPEEPDVLENVTADTLAEIPSLEADSIDPVEPQAEGSETTVDASAENLSPPATPLAAHPLSFVPSAEVANHEEIDVDLPATPDAVSLHEPAQREIALVQTSEESILPPEEAPEASTTVRASEEPISAVDLFSDLIDHDDLPLAYWLARSLMERGEDPPVPDWLLAAVYGARLLTFAHEGVGLLVNDLQEIVLLHEVDEDHTHQLLAFAASLRPALLAPSAGLINWVTSPSICPALQPLAAAIRRFADRKITMRAEDLTDVVDAESRERAINEIVAEARVWLRDAPSYRTKYVPATNIWGELVGPHGQIRALVKIVSENRRAELSTLGEQLDTWRNHDHSLERINTIDRGLRGVYWNKIDPDVLDRLQRYIGEACTLAGRWQAIVSHANNTVGSGGWRFDHTQRLCTDIQHALPDIWDSLDDLVRSAPALIAAAATTLRRAIVQLCGTLKLTIQEGTKTDFSPMSAPSLNDGLRDGLTRRLWLLPEVAPGDNDEPESQALQTIGSLISHQQIRERTVIQAINAWLEAEDYRFVDSLLTSITDQAMRDTLTRRIQDARHASTATLRSHVEASRSKLDLAFADSIIDEYERTKITSQIQAIEPASGDTYRRDHAQLRELDGLLDQARDRRIAVLETQWRDLHIRLAERNLSVDDREIIEHKVTEVLHRRDPRLIEEELDLVRRILGGRSVDEYWRTHSMMPALGERQIEFLRNRDRLVAALKPGLSTVTGALRSGQAIEGVAQPVSADGLKALESWRNLKQTPGKLVVTHLKTLLAFLGFENAEVSETASSSPSLRRTWSVAQVSRAQPNSQPIPQFGSLSPTQTIIVLWESQESVTTAIQRISVQARQAILVYLGTLNTQQRRDISRLGRGTEKQSAVTLAALDEPLLLALAQEQEALLRFRLFLHYSLPTTLLNPYMPNNRGNIPSEIFFGRNDLAESLQDPQGSCIIYGGRQLGKSALLYEAGRRFVRLQAHYATVEDIYAIGESPEQPPSSLWIRIRNAFRDKFKLTGQVKTERPDDIIARIQRVLDENQECHVLILLDEADAFLDADSRDRFQVVLDLCRLMSSTRGRFKVVFAGLHNVQRFASLPNQPLAQFGTPICVGPLEPPHAAALVTLPLAALGYHFRDTTSVARVLSYTNYHAGLLQIFCDDLLRHLQGRPRSAEPPIYIEQTDIDQTYVRIKPIIQERFNLTLSLDLRYKAITLAVIANQIGAPHLYAGTYRLSEIRQLVTVWWPQGFRTVNDEALRALLDEMCGLGILVYTPEGAYRLRNPNLVRLLGTDRDINSELAQLQQIHPVTESDIATYHALLDIAETPKPYSPLTYAQERLLNQNRSGIVLVFASDASGLARLPGAFMRFLSDEALQETRDHGIPLAVIRKRQIGTWLAEQQQRYPQQERLVFTARLASIESDELASIVHETLEWCRQNHTHKPFVRVGFVLDPKVAAVWLQLPREQRADLESRVDAVIALEPWSEHAVRQRLLYDNKLTLPDVCKQIMEATGGWAPLLDDLLRRCGKSDDPRPAAQAIAHELLQPGSEIISSFREWLAPPPPIARRLIEFLHRDVGGEATLDLIEPEYLGEPRITRDDCDTALIYLQRMGYVRLTSETVMLDPIIFRLMGQL